MKLLKNCILVFIYCFLISSCSISGEDLESSDYLANSSVSNVVLRINKDSFDALNANRLKNIEEGDPFKIVNGKKNGDFLEITVSYSGGCQIHKFDVVWDGIVFTNDPCNMNLIIIHKANNDSCEASITETIIVNLKELLGNNDYINKCSYSIFSTYNSTENPNIKILGTN